ncbi:hypothetical protein [Scytonema sp. HK-05]
MRSRSGRSAPSPPALGTWTIALNRFTLRLEHGGQQKAPKQLCWG